MVTKRGHSKDEEQQLKRQALLWFYSEFLEFVIDFGLETSIVYVKRSAMNLGVCPFKALKTRLKFQDKF